MSATTDSQTTNALEPLSSAQIANKILVTPEMIDALRQTKPWAFVVSISGLLGVVLFVGLATLGLIFQSAKSFSAASIASLVPGLLASLLYSIPSWFLYRSAMSISRLIGDAGTTDDFEQALRLQKSFWKFVGILTLVGFGLFILGIVAAILVPQFARP